MEQISKRELKSAWVEADGDIKALEWVWGVKWVLENGGEIEVPGKKNLKWHCEDRKVWRHHNWNTNW